MTTKQKFKAGDKVRIAVVPTLDQIRLDDAGNLSDWRVGAKKGMELMKNLTGTAVEVDADGDVIVEIGGRSTWYWAPEHLELVEAA